MKEITRPISEVRQKLPTLAKAAEQRMERVVITQQGRAQAVLLGYEDYLGLKTAVELLRRPGLAEGMEAASAELERGEGVALDGLKEAVASAGAFRPIRFSPSGPPVFAGGVRVVELRAEALLNKGKALTQIGKPDEAIASYDEVIGLLSPQTQELEKA